MKAIKTLLAVSALAAAGAAHSATVATLPVNSFSASIILTMGTASAEVVSQSSGSGTATLDDSGVLTIQSSVHMATIVGTDNTMDITTVVNGTWDGTTFTSNGTGSHTFANCVDSGPAGGCGMLADGPATTTGSLTLAAGGTVTSSFANTQAGAVTTFTYSIGPAAVPVPAAAWLFGSGLLGLVGTARRRAS